MAAGYLPNPPEPEIDMRILAIHFPATPATGPAKWYPHFYRGLGTPLKELRPGVVHLGEEPGASSHCR